MIAIPVLLILFWVGIYYYIKNWKPNPKCPHCGSINTSFLWHEPDKQSKYNRQLDVYQCKTYNGYFERCWNNDYLGITKITYKR